MSGKSHGPMPEQTHVTETPKRSWKRFLKFLPLNLMPNRNLQI